MGVTGRVGAKDCAMTISLLKRQERSIEGSQKLVGDVEGGW
jgi:hypothetical protein